MQFRKRRRHERQISRATQPFSLTNLREGEKATINHASGGFGLVRRLAEMGLTPGVEIKLLRRSPFCGPLQVEVRGVALALGYGVASRIFVTPAKAKTDG